VSVDQRHLVKDAVDPRVVGARFHEEIARHLKASDPETATWFASNARALQAHSERDPRNPEPELEDADADPAAE